MIKETKLEVETRPCKDCKNMSKLWDGWSYCDKLMMKVIPDMKVAYKKTEGTCFEKINKNDS